MWGHPYLERPHFNNNHYGKNKHCHPAGNRTPFNFRSNREHFLGVVIGQI